METDQQTGAGRKRGKRDRTAARLDPRTPVAFVDSSAIVALVDRDDTTHTAAVEAYRSLVADGYRLFTTNHVVVEVYDLLSGGVGAGRAFRCGRQGRQERDGLRPAKADGRKLGPAGGDDTARTEGASAPTSPTYHGRRGSQPASSNGRDDARDE